MMFPLLKHIIKSHPLLATWRSLTSETEHKIHVLVTGPPGVGKTTLVRKVCSELERRVEGVELRGFSTEEVREEYMWAGTKHFGPKIGFDVVSMSGKRGSLARVDVGGWHLFQFGRKGPATNKKKNKFVGKYRVFLKSFERLALPSLQILPRDIGHSERKRRRLYVIDEIGEMGLYSKTFATSVRALLQGGLHPPPRKTTIDPITVMATFPVSGQTHKLLKEVKSREDCVLFEVTEENRDSLVTEISDFLSQSLSR